MVKKKVWGMFEGSNHTFSGSYGPLQHTLAGTMALEGDFFVFSFLAF
jgi:hypothetical protein